MRKQLPTFFGNIPSKFQCGFKKSYSTQHFPILMLEKWKLAVNSNEAFGALLIDLSKAFDCINHTDCEVAFLWLVINIFKINK